MGKVEKDINFAMLQVERQVKQSFKEQLVKGIKTNIRSFLKRIRNLPDVLKGKLVIKL